MEGLAIELAPNEKRCSKCKEVKDRGEFRKRKDGLRSECKYCSKKTDFEKRQRKILKKDPASIECPICNRFFLNLITHAKKTHCLQKDGLAKFGVKSFISPKTKEKTKAGGDATKIRYQKTDARLNSAGIFFPSKYIPLDCKFVRIKVEREKLRINFNPVNKPLTGSRKLSRKGGNSTYIISVPTSLLENLEVIRPTFELRNNAGFYIQFYEEDYALLDVFIFWSKTNTGHCLSNSSALTTRASIENFYVSIADHIWPLNAEYAVLEWNETTRNQYLDVIPISRTDYIVGQGLKFKQVFPDNKKLKVIRDGNRLRINAIKFSRGNNIPLGAWDLVKTLPSGALRFRMYRERQPKEQLEEIARY